jgi:hypothetical protein
MRFQITINHGQRIAAASIEADDEAIEGLSIQIDRDDDGQWVLWAFDDRGREPIGAYPTWREAVAAFSQTIVFEVGHGNGRG